MKNYLRFDEILANLYHKLMSLPRIPVYYKLCPDSQLSQHAFSLSIPSPEYWTG